jgi:hypothetical protein
MMTNSLNQRTMNLNGVTSASLNFAEQLLAETGPYFHDGSVATLEESVKIMGEYQLGQIINDEDTADIVAFMKALTGDLPMEYIAPPTLPESGPDTPPPPTEKHLTN